jgi:predicted nucleic-acid-binding protein
LTGDDPAQTQRVGALLGSNDILISTTVLIESEWVLRSNYKLKKDEVLDGLQAVANLPRVRLEAPESFALALAWARAGMDFADAFHLAAAKDCEAFVTFDRRLIRQTRRQKALPAREP